MEQSVIESIESKIRSLQHEQALRSDKTQTQSKGFSHPHSKNGRDGIKACRDLIRTLQAQVSELTQEAA